MKAHYSGREPFRIYPHIHVFNSLLPVWEDRQGQNGRMAERSKALELNADNEAANSTSHRWFESSSFHIDSMSYSPRRCCCD